MGTHELYSTKTILSWRKLDTITCRKFTLSWKNYMVDKILGTHELYFTRTTLSRRKLDTKSLYNVWKVHNFLEKLGGGQNFEGP